MSGFDSNGLLATYCVASPIGTATTLAGNGSFGSADGTGADARFYYPRGVAVDGDGNVYVADHGNHTIRKITPAGVVTTLAGTAGPLGQLMGPAPTPASKPGRWRLMGAATSTSPTKTTIRFVRSPRPVWSPRWPAPPSRLGR